MTDKKEPGDGQRAADPAAKRPHATLDIKAVEVKSEPPASAPPGTAAKDQKPAQASLPAADKTAATSGAGGPASGAAAAGKTADSTKPAPPTAPPPQRGSPLLRGVTHLIAGLAGGTVVLFGGDWLAQNTALPTPAARSAEQLAAADKRIALLESAFKSGASDVLQSQLSAAADKLSALETAVQGLEPLRTEQARLAAEASDLRETIAGLSLDPKLQERLTRLEGQLSTLATAAGNGDGGSIPQLAAVTGKIADLEATLNTQIGALRQTLPQDLETRLASVGEASETAKSSTARIDRDMTQLKTDLVRISQRLETLKAEDERLAQNVSAAQEEAGRIASSMANVRSELDKQTKSAVKQADVAAVLAPVTGKLSKIEEDLSGVLASEADRRSNTERIVVSLELGNLKRAIERGGGYASELAAVQQAAGGRLDLAALDRHKAEGVPTLPALQATGRDVLLKALDRSAEPADAGVWERLLAGAQSVVRVRKINHDADPASPEAVVARMETALAAGRLDTVLEESRALPAPAQDAISGWRQTVEARQSVDAAIAAVENELKAALVSAPEKPGGQE